MAYEGYQYACLADTAGSVLRSTSCGLSVPGRMNRSCGWGSWVIWVGLALGLYSAVASFRSSLAAMNFMSKDRKDTEPPPVSFNDHI